MATKRLYRSVTNRVVAGVLGGLGEYFGVDTNLLRIVWVAITIFSGFFPGLFIYLIAIILVPLKPME